MSRLVVVTALRSPDLVAAVDDLTGHLARCGFSAVPPGEPDAILVWADDRLPDDVLSGLLARAADGVPVLLGGATFEANLDRAALADAAGVVAGRSTPRHETRLRSGLTVDDVL